MCRESGVGERHILLHVLVHANLQNLGWGLRENRFECRSTCTSTSKQPRKLGRFVLKVCAFAVDGRNSDMRPNKGVGADQGIERCEINRFLVYKSAK